MSELQFLTWFGIGIAVISVGSIVVVLSDKKAVQLRQVSQARKFDQVGDVFSDMIDLDRYLENERRIYVRAGFLNSIKEKLKKAAFDLYGFLQSGGLKIDKAMENDVNIIENICLCMRTFISYIVKDERIILDNTYNSAILGLIDNVNKFCGNTDINEEKFKQDVLRNKEDIYSSLYSLSGFTGAEIANFLKDIMPRVGQFNDKDSIKEYIGLLSGNWLQDNKKLAGLKPIYIMAIITIKNILLHAVNYNDNDAAKELFKEIEKITSELSDKRLDQADVLLRRICILGFTYDRQKIEEDGEKAAVKVPKVPVIEAICDEELALLRKISPAVVW